MERTFCGEGAATAWLMTVGPSGGMDPGELHSLEVHRDLGVQFRQHEPAPLAHRERRAEAGRESRRDRRVPIPYREGSGLAHRAAARYGRRARDGAHPHVDRGRPDGQGLHREIHARLRRARGAREAANAGVGGDDHGRAGGRDPAARARVRRHAAVRDPDRRCARAPLRRRSDRARRDVPARARRRVARRRRRDPRDARVGASVPVRRHLPAGLDPPRARAC